MVYREDFNFKKNLIEIDFDFDHFKDVINCQNISLEPIQIQPYQTLLINSIIIGAPYSGFTK